MAGYSEIFDLTPMIGKEVAEIRTTTVAGNEINRRAAGLAVFGGAAGIPLAVMLVGSWGMWALLICAATAAIALLLFYVNFSSTGTNGAQMIFDIIREDRDGFYQCMRRLPDDEVVPRWCIQSCVPVDRREWEAQPTIAEIVTTQRAPEERRLVVPEWTAPKKTV